MTDERIESIQARLDAATPAPWFWNSYSAIHAPCPKGHPLDIAGEDEPGIAAIATLRHTGHGDEMPDAEARANAELIENAPCDLRDLLREVRALQERLSADFARAGECVG